MSPDALAEVIRPHLGTALLGLDVDGVLAPLVEHADDSVLTPGVSETLDALAERTTVMILSGRSLADLTRLFDFPPTLHVFGSHGSEARDEAFVELSDDEQYTFDQLEILGTKAVEASGDGAWLERKPASVSIHRWAADPARAVPAADAVANLAGMIDGAQVKRGHEVVELLARRADKGETLLRVAERLGRTPIVYVGDDVTDEDAFRLMGDDGLSIKVGPGETAARHRLDDPTAAAELLHLLLV